MAFGKSVVMTERTSSMSFGLLGASAAASQLLPLLVISLKYASR